MPRKNIIKIYAANSYYHVYNRGIDKREIFLEEKDCKMFLYYLKLYLSDPDIIQNQAKNISPQLLFKLRNRNLYNEIKLLSFALMPNHFHLQVRQITNDGMKKLMQRLIPSYVQYFNRKYNRVGPLFESIYKAVLTKTDEQYIYLSSYIHRNPMKLKNSRFDFIRFSSYPYYLGDKHANWINTEDILSLFKTTLGKENIFSYQHFVENFLENPETILQDLVLEDDY